MNNQAVKVKTMACSGVFERRMGTVKCLPVLYNLKLFQYGIKVLVSKTQSCPCA
jgi:hypothetical protein